MGGADRKHSGGRQAEGSALAIVVGIVLDGIPESIVLGLTIGGLAQAGWAKARILDLWGLVAVVSGLAALLGFVAFDSASAGTVAFVLAFAGGAILTMLDTMMPRGIRARRQARRPRHHPRLRTGFRDQRPRVGSKQRGVRTACKLLLPRWTAKRTSSFAGSSPIAPAPRFPCHRGSFVL
jgi:hypothetical protein